MALSTFSDLKTELSRRGFEYLSDTVLGNFINNAYSDICEAEDWPFLEASTTGTAPKTVSDLRTIESVINTTTLDKLRPIDRRDLTDWAPDLTLVGTASYYYITTGSIVNVYPADTTSSLTIRYWKVPTVLSAAPDVPLVPSRFLSLVVDAAVVYGFEDDDEQQQADAASARFQVRLERMKQSLMGQQHDQADQSVLARDFGAWGGY